MALLPMSMAAMTGPTPKMSVRLVPDAFTALRMRRRDCLICASMPAMSAASSASNSLRSSATGPVGVSVARNLAASVELLLLGDPSW